MSENYDYRAGVQPLCEVGAVEPCGKRVLLRAILSADFYTGDIWLPPMASTDADCFEIIAVGEDITSPKIRVGRHCEVRSTAADRVDSKNITGRYWNVDVADITAVWDPQEVTPEIAAACERIANAGKALLHATSSTGEIDPQPVSPLLRR